MKLGLVVLIVLTVACTQGGQSAVKTASPTPVSSPVQSPSPAASPLAPPGDLPLSQVSFSCRLPIYMQTGYETSPDFARQSAFITFPSASMAIDPSGKGGAYFDLAFKRWLPVRRGDVSPDDTHYAYVGIQDNLLHVVNVTDGKERIFSLDAAGVNYVFDYAAAPDATSQKTIFTGPLVGTLGSTIADSHGVWFGSPQGIYLYSEAGGLQKVSNLPSFLANGCF